MGKVRPLIKEDIPHLVRMHPKAFEDEDSNRPPDAYFEEVFLNNPWIHESMPSLVFEQNNGEIAGFLGVISRPFSFKQQSIRAAICLNFMVDPSIGNSAVGLQLFKSFISGPQDLSLADFSNTKARKIWNLFKSHTLWVYSLRWNRTFQSYASQRVQSLLKKSKQSVFSRCFCSIIDSFDKRMWNKHLRPEVPKVYEVEINENTIVELLPEFYGNQFLRPEYNMRSLLWLFRRAAAKKQLGKFRKVGVSNETGDIIGWCIYHLIPGLRARVLQLAAKHNYAGDVIDLLFHHAWQNKINSVTGRLEPPLINALVSKPGISYGMINYWMMVHARDHELLSAIHRGEAFLTELDGERLLGSYGEKF
jgi:hypothetical protein